MPGGFVLPAQSNFGQIAQAYLRRLGLGLDSSHCDRHFAVCIQEIIMKKTLLALVTSAVLAIAMLAPTTADARCRGCGVGLGVVGGLAAGAIIGAAAVGATAATVVAPGYAYPQAYYPVAGYEPYEGYRVAPAYGCPGGYWARRPIRDQFGNVVGMSRPRFFCPAG
jgi:hypothetical protein